MSRFLKLTVTLATLIIACQSVMATEPTNYYSKAIGQSDAALMKALRDIIYNHKELSYSSGLLSAFRAVDTDSEGYIIDIYSNCRYKPSDNGSSASTVGEGYNREHSFPRSWFNGAVAPMNTDVFHIYPTDIHVNSQRSNYPYGVCANGTRLSNGSYVAKGKLGQSTYPGYSGTVFEPDDEYKGDLARTYFYMATCYMNELPSWPGSAQLNYSQNKYKAFSTWTINMLMEWTRLDPVSEKEIKRNDAIYNVQGNRNPFIDHPELAEYIWGNMQGNAWPGNGEQPDPAITSPANGSHIDMGSTTVGVPISHTFTVKGEGLSDRVIMTMTDDEFYYVSKSSFTAAEVIAGTSVTITFTADEEGTFNNTVTVGSDEASTTFTITATATPQGGDKPGELGDSIVEDWEGCTTGGYWTKAVQGHAWMWNFTDAGIWGDNLKHGELVCRLGKTPASVIEMAQDVEGGTSAIGFWASAYGSDGNATLQVESSVDGGASWNTVGAISVANGGLQRYLMAADVEGTVRFRIGQTAGMRVDIDDITLYGRVSQPVKGDVNGDGEVNIADVNTLIDLILGNEISHEIAKRADVNGDSEINVADVNALIDLILSH